jgi:hypothetical protein
MAIGVTDRTFGVGPASGSGTGEGCLRRRIFSTASPGGARVPPALDEGRRRASAHCRAVARSETGFAVQARPRDTRKRRSQRDDDDIAMRAPAGRAANRRRGFRFTSDGSAARAPWMNSMRRYLLPCLEMPSSFGLPPVVTCRGTSPGLVAGQRQASPALARLRLPRARRLFVLPTPASIFGAKLSPLCLAVDQIMRQRRPA